jgi:hypothetical protein
MSQIYDLWWDRIMHVPECLNERSFYQARETEPMPKNPVQPVPLNVNIDKYFFPRMRPVNTHLGNRTTTRRSGYASLSNYSVYG